MSDEEEEDGMKCSFFFSLSENEALDVKMVFGFLFFCFFFASTPVIQFRH